MKRKILLTMAFLAGVLSMAACQNGVVGDITTNKAPDTTVTGGVPYYPDSDETAQTTFSVEFLWTGSDPDGWVDHFEWRISDNGENNMVDVGDTLGLPWNATVATDSVFVVSADMDSFMNDVLNPDIESPNDYRYWQTHTFFIRAVDNLGAPDPTPFDVSFTALTLAPSVRITLPADPGGNICVSSARALTFGWEGNDPDEITGQPAAARYALVNTDGFTVPGSADTLAMGACLTRTEYEALNPVPYFSEDDWSDWIPYAAGEDSGRVVTFPINDFGQSFFFAVQLKDVAGAVTPTFRWNTNLRHVKVQAGKRPALNVTEEFLGTDGFTGRGVIKNFEIVAGQPLNFNWTGDASSYAGIIEAYRYGWEIQDVNDDDDPGWAVPWGKGESFLRAGERSFQQGSPNFVVQCRDNSGEVTRGTYRFDVIQITPRAQQFDLLMIDDFGTIITDAEDAIRREWRGQWEQMLSRVQNFDTAVDYFVASESRNEIDFRLVNRYKSVIWFNSGSNFSTVYHQILRPQIGQARYNWLEVYQSKVGNLLFCGPYATLGMVEMREWDLPLVYNSEDPPPDGMGCETQLDGSCLRLGTTSWPYTGWCLDASDVVRPQGNGRFGEEAGTPRTSTYDCDYLFRAEVAPIFLASYPSANGLVEDLITVNGGARMPQPNGVPARSAFFKYSWEEFYNRNITEKPVTLLPRSCQLPMYLHRAARDEVYPIGHPDAGDPLVAFADSLCSPLGSESSPLNGANIAIVSSVYSGSKQLPGSNDFLWGFHPLAFDQDRVESALLWIIEQNWDIAIGN